MIELITLGAAQTVTGSKHLLRTSRTAILLDCGLFQGRRAEAWELNKELPHDIVDVDAVVLSHAHIDHSGALPVLAKRGYSGPIYATPATIDLCAPMLLDVAHIQKSDAQHIDHLVRSGRADLRPVEPLYADTDVERVLPLFVPVGYHEPVSIAPGVCLTFFDAGHVLGSAITVLDIEDNGERIRLAFTGDLGPHHQPILRSPEIPGEVNVLVMESTYGDRFHAPAEQMTDDLALLLERTFARGGKVVIPSFALERAQEIMFALNTLHIAGRLPAVPVYIDSPLTVKITEVFRRHPECYGAESAHLIQSEHSPFTLPTLTYVSDAEGSKRIDATEGPAIIISASGMCEAGRILHHLQATIEDPRNTIVIVGFQAQHTLGRRLAEHRREVRIFGAMRTVAAEVVVMDGFSAHADQRALLTFAEHVGSRGRLSKVILVHGEPPAQTVLAHLLRERCVCSDIVNPGLGERIALSRRSSHAARIGVKTA